MALEYNYDYFLTDDDILKYATGMGSPKQAMTNMMYGLPTTNLRPAMRKYRYNQGYVFFTRPQLNFATNNIRSRRQYNSLLTENPNSVHRYVRCILDPRIHKTERIRSNMVNESIGFIPVLTNTITNLTGFQDMVVPTFSSKAGLKGEQWSIADGYVDTYGEYDIDCSFHNFIGEPITSLFQMWEMFSVDVHEGMVGVYMDFIAANEICYNTRIYRLIMDETMTFVEKMCATGASFPISIPMGEMFNYDSEPVFQQNDKINIRFKCNGATYNDSILVTEFNAVSGIFNEEVDRLNEKGETDKLLVVDDILLLNALNYRCIPWIDPDDNSLKWLIDKNSKSYQHVKKFFK